MSVNLVLALVVGGLFAVGCYLLLQRTLMRIVLGFLLIGHGANLLLLLSGGPAGRAAFVGAGSPAQIADPLPQAMALTAIVITFGLTTFLLALAYRSWVLTGRDDVQDDIEDQRIRRMQEPPEREE